MSTILTTGHNLDSEPNSDNIVPVEPVNCQPQESSSHDSSEVDQPQASLDQLELSDVTTFNPQQQQLRTNATQQGSSLGKGPGQK